MWQVWQKRADEYRTYVGVEVQMVDAYRNVAQSVRRAETFSDLVSITEHAEKLELWAQALRLGSLKKIMGLFIQKMSQHSLTTDMSVTEVTKIFELVQKVGVGASGADVLQQKLYAFIEASRNQHMVAKLGELASAFDKKPDLAIVDELGGLLLSWSGWVSTDYRDTLEPFWSKFLEWLPEHLKNVSSVGIEKVFGTNNMVAFAQLGGIGQASKSWATIFQCTESWQSSKAALLSSTPGSSSIRALLNSYTEKHHAATQTFKDLQLQNVPLAMQTLLTLLLDRLNDDKNTDLKSQLATMVTSLLEHVVVATDALRPHARGGSDGKPWFAVTHDPPLDLLSLWDMTLAKVDKQGLVRMCISLKQVCVVSFHALSQTCICMSQLG